MGNNESQELDGVSLLHLIEKHIEEKTEIDESEFALVTSLKITTVNADISIDTRTSGCDIASVEYEIRDG